MICGAVLCCSAVLAAPAKAAPLRCDLTGYHAKPGLSAILAGDTLTLRWSGEGGAVGALAFGRDAAGLVIRTVAIGRGRGPAAVVAHDVRPVYEVVSGYRRVTEQQLQPLRKLGVAIDDAVIDRIKWDAFWDAPLEVPGGAGHGTATPPPGGVGRQKGLPRTPDEIRRAGLTLTGNSCTVATDGQRLVVAFAGAGAGPFTGRLEFTIYKGSNLVQQDLVAKTDQQSVAYKYSAGLEAAAAADGRLLWRTNASARWISRPLDGAPGPSVPVKTANRLIALEAEGAGIAAFPPPHRFFWARENEYDLGYNWFRRIEGGRVGLGVRQADREEPPAYAGHGEEDVAENFSLYSARPGTWQRMPVFFYLSPDGGKQAIQGALRYTRGDSYKPLPGYKVMATHFHTALVKRLDQLGNLSLPDLDLMRAAGVDIFAPIDGPDESGVTPPGASGVSRPKDASAFPALARYYAAAARHSDSEFLVLPDYEELYGLLGGHMDFLLSHPTYYVVARRPGEPFVADDPVYGHVYRIGSPADAVAMAEREKMLLFMPHPRSKGSTGYPDAIRDSAYFKSPVYAGIGIRWGMGQDGSETRLCALRCLATLDDMNNWVADLPIPPKYGLAISETYYKGPGDDIYANNPVNYVRLARVPAGADWSPITDALRRGDFFWTSGEVLIPETRITGNGDRIAVAAKVEWTFPLDFVELVWGDGAHTHRKIVSATHLPPNGSTRFDFALDAPSAKWVRFAAWDIAGNGAFAQPVKIFRKRFPPGSQPRPDLSSRVGGAFPGHRRVKRIRILAEARLTRVRQPG